MLFSRLSATLLLTATCLLLASDVSMESLILCDGVEPVQHLSCDTGVISVQGALYGRADRETCSEGRSPQQLANTRCSLPGTTDRLRGRCNGKKVCELNSAVVGVTDPCYGISKYLQTNFTCLPAFHLYVCENTFATLQCAQGQIIYIHGAHYGRRDPSICSFQRPQSQTQNVLCSRPVTNVLESCNGQNSCNVKAANAQFTDPCYGTYKYLELAYTCLYPN